MKFFIDNNISRKVAHGLSEFGEEVIHLQDKFPDDTPDVEWLKYVGEQGMVLITRDERIRINPAERKALKKYKVKTFFIGGKNKSRCDLIRQIVNNWPRMKEYAKRLKSPFAYRVPPKGTKYSKIPLD